MATSVKQADFVKTALRLPPDLHARVHDAAQKSSHSYNAELIERIAKSFDFEEQAARAAGETDKLKREVEKLRREKIALQVEVSDLKEGSGLEMPEELKKRFIENARFGGVSVAAQIAQRLFESLTEEENQQLIWAVHAVSVAHLRYKLWWSDTYRYYLAQELKYLILVLAGFHEPDIETTLVKVASVVETMTLDRFNAPDFTDLATEVATFKTRLSQIRAKRTHPLPEYIAARLSRMDEDLPRFDEERERLRATGYLAWIEQRASKIRSSTNDNESALRHVALPQEPTKPSLPELAVQIARYALATEGFETRHRYGVASLGAILDVMQRMGGDQSSPPA